MNVHERIYARLCKLGVLDLVDAGSTAAKSQAEGYMDLSLDVLVNGETLVIALAHRYEQNGDLMADPDMEIRIDRVHELAEALTFQQDSTAIYQVVYPEPGRVLPRLKHELNAFLDRWLSNAIAQGHGFRRAVEAVRASA